MFSGLCRPAIAFKGYQMQHAYRRALHWPTSPNPTPYQIFGLENKVFDKKKLQVIYFELVKVYHPDRGVTGNSERFKKVVEAHNILRDDAKRHKYDFDQKMNYKQDASFDYKQKCSSDFGDYFDLNYWSAKNQERFDRGLRENRIWVLKLISFLVVTFGILNFMMLQQVAMIRSEVQHAQTEKVAWQLAQARDNFGTGRDAKDRIQRFLSHRQRMIEKFDHEFSYDKLKGRNPRSKPLRDSSSQDVGNLNRTIASECADPELNMEPCDRVDMLNSKGVRQSKANTGRVSEYFGRT